jgi:pimeloyl-ACP methyl ester carboxylesterase
MIGRAREVAMDFITVRNGATELNVAVSGTGPLIVCVHGFPELWYSWRHQMAHFAARGFRVAALDVRGYGRSSKPKEIAAYTLRQLASDVVAVIDHFGNEPAILFGHDWGAPIVWHTALLHPDRIRAVAGLSVPYRPRGPAPFIDVVRSIYKGWFFYQIYFQQEGVAEAELEADVARGLRMTYFALSGEAPLNLWLEPKPPEANVLDGLVDPQPFPAWMSDDDLAVYVDAFRAGGFRGPLNRYRAQNLDFADLAELGGRGITQPSVFIAGERDPVRAFIPGMDLYAEPGIACADFRGSTILPGVGHWVQQEAPDETNAALEAFVRSL